MNIIRKGIRGRIKNYEENIKSLKNDQLLLENIYSPLNLSDYYSIYGKYLNSNENNNLGYESLCKIKEIGSNLDLKIKEKYCLSLNLNNEDNLGGYSKYNINNRKKIILLPNNFTENDLILLSNFLINPLTVYNLIKYSINKKIIINASNSNIGKFIIYKSIINNYKVIGLSREINNFVDNSNFFNFNYDEINEIKNKIEEIKPDLFLDCLSNENFNFIFNLLPKNSTSLVYGTILNDKLNNVFYF